MVKLDSNTEQRLIQLRNKIESNNANLDDYSEYETILTNTGKFSKDDILGRLKKYGFMDWKDYYSARQAKIFSDKKVINKNTEGELLGSILGLGLGVILLSKMATVAR